MGCYAVPIPTGRKRLPDDRPPEGIGQKTMKLSARLTFAALVAATLFAAGCSDGGPSSKVYVKTKDGTRLRVAVLPFDNVSANQDAGRVMTNTVITYLLSTGAFDVVEPGVVNATLANEGVRITDGLTVDIGQRIQPKLNADAYIMGMVEEYGEVRIGPDTYPSVSFSARLVNARTTEILWAGTISKTGADSVKVFDIGRVSSLGKLSKKAVASMAESLAKSRKQIMAGLAAQASIVPIADHGTPPTPVTPPTNPVVTEPPIAVTPPVTPTPEPPISVLPPTTGTGPRYMDETATYGQPEMTALLKDVDGAKLGDVVYKKHFHDTIETQYRIGDKGKVVEVKLVDYLKSSIALKFVQDYNKGSQQTAFDTLPAYTGESGFGYYHLDIAPGRFGVYIRGPKDNKADIESLARGIIALLK